MSWNRFNSLSEAIAEKIHNFGTDQLKVALSNSSPTAGMTQLSNITEISYTNLTSRNVTTTSSGHSSGAYKLILAALTLVASGTIPAFRYIILYNDTATNDELIAWADYGSSVNMVSGDEFTINFDGTNGLLRIS